MTEKIDIVYLWVDGSDKKWQKIRNFWFDKTYDKTREFANNMNSALYRDNGELRYSLRSVAECADWVNHIYIITGFNQVPKWLNAKHPKITIVPHEQIMPKNAIPTFNSNSIAMCIANIPNLAEKFIIMNDDTFFNKKIKPSFFFDKSGRAIVLYNKHKGMQRNLDKWRASVDRYTHTLILSALKIQEIFGKTFLKYRPSHGIDPYIKSSFLECRNHKLVKEQLDKQILDKFRMRNALQMWLFELYAKMTNKAVFKKARGYKSGKHKFTNFIYNTLFFRATRRSPVFCFDAVASTESIRHAPIFCINDSKHTTEDTIKSNIEFLARRFPNPSPFEKDIKSDIDMVYLWVDGTDKKWRTEKDKWHKLINGEKPVYADAAHIARFRDNGEFRYSLRSVAECAPWVHHIYIITGFNQVPKWLNTTHPKITIVPHEKIMPAAALPTFNATSIEMCIPKIPGLADKFLLMNDDVFFNRTLSPKFFFDAAGRARVHYTSYSSHAKDVQTWLASADDYTQTLILSAKIIDDAFDKKLYFARPTHGIDPYIKSSWIECARNKIIKKQINTQVLHKFRTNDEIQRWAFNLYDLAMGRAVFWHARPKKYSRHKFANLLYNFIHRKSNLESNITCTNVVCARRALVTAPIFCINDAPENDATILNQNREFLESRFPNKCEFEK